MVRGGLRQNVEYNPKVHKECRRKSNGGFINNGSYLTNDNANDFKITIGL